MWVMGATWAVPALFVLAAALGVAQGFSIAHATTLIPKSWKWAYDKRVVWTFAAVMSAASVVTALLIYEAQRAAARSTVRRDLQVATLPDFQSPISISTSNNTKLRWTPVFLIRNDGEKPVVIEDLVPRFPAEITTDGQRAQLVRTKRSELYEAFDTFGKIAEAQGRNGADFGVSDEWPLPVPAGKRLIVETEQEYEFRIGGRPVHFRSNEYLLRLVGAYLELPQDGHGRYIAAMREIPTKVTSSEDRWQVDVDYMAVPAGTGLLVPNTLRPDELR
jgi:hypothetical protein